MMDAKKELLEQNSEQKEPQDVKEIPLSEKIGDLLGALVNVQEVYKTSGERVLHMDRLTQDLLHALELQKHNYHERARIATELHKCRVQRRPDKDNVHLTEPVAGYLRSDKGQRFLKQLEHLYNLEQHTERTAPECKYTPRVLTAEEYRDLGKKQSHKQQLKLRTQSKAEQEMQNG